MPDGSTGTFILPVPEQTFSSNHVSGAQFALGDGSVRFVSYNIDYKPTPFIGADPGTNALIQSLGGVVGPITAANMGIYNRLGDRQDGFPVGDF
jgi:hypothetical protein